MSLTSILSADDIQNAIKDCEGRMSTYAHWTTQYLKMISYDGCMTYMQNKIH